MLDFESFKQEFRNKGLKPTDQRSKLGRVWVTADGVPVLVPDTIGKIPDAALDDLLRQIDKLDNRNE